MPYRQAYAIWKEKALADADVVRELATIWNDNEAVEDRFYRELAFGTGGLRGVLGAGTNRMNVYTVGKATQGYARYLLGKTTRPSVAIAYDSRHKSALFAQTAAAVFAANGIHAHIYSTMMPTPALSFAVRALGCDGGIVITASHNPGKYNGYKVYGKDGCQITDGAAYAILQEINKIDPFADVHAMPFEEGLAAGGISYIAEAIHAAYLAAVSAQSMLHPATRRDISIVYTPLHGTGITCVPQCLAGNGFTNITIPPSQREPDGDFPTCPYPNPEEREALEVGLACAEAAGSDLLLATDPDCDRVGVAVRHKGEYVLISGNKMGVLLLDFVCKQRKARGTMPKVPVAVKTIVTTPMAQKVADAHGVQLLDVLTGFKYIGEQIGMLEDKREEARYIFGFEESYGYLSGTHVRDKDAANASLLICEMAAYYKNKGMTLVDALEGLRAQYGTYVERLVSFDFEGAKGMEQMQGIMRALRSNPPEQVAETEVSSISDYLAAATTYHDGRPKRAITLPKSDVLSMTLKDGAMLVIRPSGTEPKLKLYAFAGSEGKIDALLAYMTGWMDNNP